MCQSREVSCAARRGVLQTHASRRWLFLLVLLYHHLVAFLLRLHHVSEALCQVLKYSHDPVDWGDWASVQSSGYGGAALSRSGGLGAKGGSRQVELQRFDEIAY